MGNVILHCYMFILVLNFAKLYMYFNEFDIDYLLAKIYKLLIIFYDDISHKYLEDIFKILILFNFFLII